MATHAWQANGFGGFPMKLAMHATSTVGNARYVSNTLIAIAAKVLVLLKNLFRLKGSLGHYLDDANTLQHLSELTQVCSSPVRISPVPNAGAKSV